MPTTPIEDLFTAIQTMMATVSSAAPYAITAAPSHYGTDFKIAPETTRYQVRMTSTQPYYRGNVEHPRAEIEIELHHYRSPSVAASEPNFCHKTMSLVADTFLDVATWAAQTGIYGLEPESDPAIGEGSRVGNVISFTVNATVLMDPA